MLRVCIDNNLASAKQRRDLESIEMPAFEYIERLNEEGKIALEISYHSLREMERAPEPHRSKLKEGVADLGRARENSKFLASTTSVDPYGGHSTQPLVTDIVDKQLYDSLRSEGLDENDAKQLMYAVHNRYDRFLTNDRKDFIRRRGNLERLCRPLRIQTPAGFWRSFWRRMKRLEPHSEAESHRFAVTPTLQPCSYSECASVRRNLD